MKSKLTERMEDYASKPSSRRSVDEGDDLMREAVECIEALETALADATDIIRPLAIRYDNTEYKPEHGAVQVPTPWGLYAKASTFIAGRAALEQGS